MPLKPFARVRPGQRRASAGEFNRLLQAVERHDNLTASRNLGIRAGAGGVQLADTTPDRLWAVISGPGPTQLAAAPTGGSLPHGTYWFLTGYYHLDGDGNPADYLATTVTSIDTPTLGPPANLTATLQTGGSLTIGVGYTYYVTTTADAGESLPASAGATPTAGPPAKQQVQLQWQAVTGATGYKVYRAGDCTTVLLGSAAATTFTDAGAAGTAATLPTADTSQTDTNTITVTSPPALPADGSGTTFDKYDVYGAPPSPTQPAALYLVPAAGTQVAIGTNATLTAAMPGAGQAAPAPPTGYSWQELSDDGKGNLVGFADARSGFAWNLPAYEVQGEAVAPGEHVELRLAADQNSYLFRLRPAPDGVSVSDGVTAVDGLTDLVLDPAGGLYLDPESGNGVATVKARPGAGYTGSISFVASISCVNGQLSVTTHKLCFENGLLKGLVTA